MQRIIYLLSPDLPGYAVDQAHLLSRYLPADQFSSELVVPGRAGSVELAALPTTSISAGLAGLFDLRRLCTAAPPACVHAWGMSAVRLLAILLRGRWCTRGVGSFLVPAATVGSLAALGRWLTRRLIAPLPAPAVPWAVECPAEPIPQRELTTLGIPAEAELIVALGDHSRTGNLNTAVWAFDVLRYIHPRAWLVIIGRGPRRDRTERFARAVAREDYRVRFVDVPFAQISRWCQRASVVWVTALRQSWPWILAGQAAGRPVLALATAQTQASANDHAGVLLLASGRGLALELANRTRHLLESPAELARLGQLNRAQVQQQHDPAAIAQQWARHYTPG